MKRSIYSLLLLILFIFSCNKEESKKIPPKAVKGVLDLRHFAHADTPDYLKEQKNENNVAGYSVTEPSRVGWDFEKDGTINLDGEWEFYWKEFVPPTDSPISNSEFSILNENSPSPIQNPKLKTCTEPAECVQNYIPVPGNWNQFADNGKPVGSDGYGTYRLRILLPKLNTSLTFKILNASTAYTMYVNGEKFASNGSVGKDKDTSIPQSLSVISSIHNSKEELEIIFHVSNFHYSKGGLWLPINIGNEKAVREIRDKNLFLDIFLSGSILIMGLYHLVIYIQRKQDKSPLLFGIYCFIIVVRLLSTGEKYLTTIFPEIPFQLLIKIEYISFYLAVPIFSHFLYTIFPREVKEKILKFIWAIGILFAISVIVTSTEIFTRTVNAYQILTLFSLLYFLFIIGLAIFRKREGSKTIFVGCLIIIIGVVNDILYNRNILSTGNIFPQCLLGFTFFQSIMLSMRFSRSFNQAEKLSNELEQKSSRLEETSLELSALTQNLELKIQERTKDLEETKKEIEDINTFSHLVNSLSDLNSIFTEISKYFYHKFGITGTWLFLPDEKREYLYAYKAYSYFKLPADKYDYMMNKKIPLKENDGGMFFKTFQRKKSLYLSRIPKFEFGIDKEIAEILEFKSFLQIPLIRKEECVGIFSFSNMLEELKLSKSDIQKISNLCSQIAGAIDTNHLLKQVDKARANADGARIEAEIERGISVIAKFEVEKAKRKTEDLNLLIKKVNETSDLEEIMKIILSYVKDNYHLPYYSLFTLDAKENVLKFANAILPDYVTSEQKKLMSSSIFSVTEKNMDSIHSRALALKTPIFIPDIEAESKTESSKAILKILKHKSFITLPIILQNNPIGTLDIFSLDSLPLREEEITELSLLAEQLAGVIQGAILFTQVQEEKEKAILAKQEIETLNEFTKLINSTSDISTIFKEIYSYLNKTFGFNNLWVLLVDKNKKELFSDMNTTVYKEGIAFDFDFFNNFHVTLDEKLGTLYQTYATATPFYITDVSNGDIKAKTLINEFNGKTYSSSKTDFKIILKGKLKSLLQIPLILQNEVIGIVCLSIFDKLLELSQDQIEKLVRFSNQIAGVIHNAQLLKQTEEAKAIADIEKEKALAAREEAEKQKRETEELNKLIKSLNEDMDIKVIMKKVHEYMKTNYNINYYGLGVVDNNKELAVTIDTCSPEFISTADQERISRFSTRVKNIVGAHAFAFKTKKLFYAPRIRKSGMNEEELFNQETTKLESILIIPLILQNEPIGFLDLYNVGKMELSKEDITKLSILGEQLAGIIHGSNLFKEVQEEKEKVEIARQDADKAKGQVEFLNEFSKVINSYNNLDIIFSHAVENLSNKIDTDIFQLQLVDKTKNELFTRCLSGTDSGLMNKYNKLRVPLIPESGSLYLAYANKKTLYLKNIKKIAENKKSELDKMVEKDFQLNSVFLIPLLVNDEVIGIMSINKLRGMKKLKADEIRFVESLCEQLALAVNNSFLLEAAESERAKSEKLLLNILPKDVAAELKEKGFAEPVLFEKVSVMFTDFKGFTTIAETLTPQELIKDLDACFVQFDKISERFNLEKLKTIGDSYMCAGGIPKRNTTHAIDCCLAALEIQSFMNLMKKLKEEKGFPYWELRLGIHTGPLIAGVIGERKFAYDVWGDTVNTASRMESSGTQGRINISYSTYEVVKDFFICEYRGEVSAKNKGVVKMYYLERIKPEFSKDEMGLMPNGKFWEVYG